EATGYRAADPEATNYAAPGDPHATRPPDPHATADPQATPVFTLSGRVLPRRFGDYELLEQIGRGGMGVVFKARQISLGRIVALKMIRGGGLPGSEAVERFRRDATAAASLDHPGIVPVHEIGEVDGEHLFSMALVPGGSLHQRLAEGPLPPREAARIVRL